MRQYEIKKVGNTFDWNEIPSLKIDTLQWTEQMDIWAGAQFCYSEEELKVHLYAKEKHIRSEETSIIGMPCRDSCLEFFFSPMEGDIRYFNIEFNLNCCMYLGIGSGPEDLVRLLPEDGLLHPIAGRTEEGWEITYSVPFSFIRRFFPLFEALPGKKIRANCYKCGDLTVKEHYLSWNPVTCSEPQFHSPNDFGIMVFGQ